MLQMSLFLSNLMEHGFKDGLGQMITRIRCSPGGAYKKMSWVEEGMVDNWD